MTFIMDESLGFIINRTAVRVKQEFTHRLRPFDLTPEQWSVLNRLGEQQGATQKELAERTYKDQPNTARILDKLEKKGLVNRVDNPQDRRAVQVFLTEQGRQLREQVIPISRQLNTDAAQGLAGADCRRLIALLNSVYDNLD